MLVTCCRQCIDTCELLGTQGTDSGLSVASLGRGDKLMPMMTSPSREEQSLQEMVGATLLVKVLVDRSCLTFCDPMDHSPSGSSVHGDSPG